MKIILYIAKKYSIPIYKPLVTFLDSSEHNYAFYLSDKVKRDFPKDWNKDKILNNLRAAKEYQADFVLSSGNFVDFRINGIKVQIFHGLGVEKPAHFKIRHFFDLYLTSGPFVTKKFMELRKKYHDYFEVRETGWLKIDYILSFDKNKYNYDFKIPTAKKIILYAPTFSNKMQSASDMIGKLNNLIADDEFWILKFHELMDKEVISHFKKQKNVLIIDSYDITPFLHLADIMISDTSSVVYEFMALNKPVITINTLSRKDKGFNVLKIEDVREKIAILKKNSQILTPNIKKNLAEVNPYLDKQIASRTISVLEEILKENNLPKKNKPFNLFRKSQIIYHSIFKKGYMR